MFDNLFPLLGLIGTAAIVGALVGTLGAVAVAELVATVRRARGAAHRCPQLTA